MRAVLRVPFLSPSDDCCLGAGERSVSASSTPHLRSIDGSGSLLVLLVGLTQLPRRPALVRPNSLLRLLGILLRHVEPCQQILSQSLISQTSRSRLERFDQLLPHRL